MPTTTLPGAVLIRTSVLTLRDQTVPPGPNRRRFNFQASTSGDPDPNGVVVPARGSSGDPTAHGATLTVYNAAGSGESTMVVLPASGWTPYDPSPTPSGYRWKPSSRADPIRRVLVRTNRIRIRGGGASWTYTLNEPVQGAIAVRLSLGSTVAWCASAPARSAGIPPSTAAYDHVDRFVAARGTAPPPTCPPLF